MDLIQYDNENPKTHTPNKNASLYLMENRLISTEDTLSFTENSIIGTFNFMTSIITYNIWNIITNRKETFLLKVAPSMSVDYLKRNYSISSFACSSAFNSSMIQFVRTEADIAWHDEE